MTDFDLWARELDQHDAEQAPMNQHQQPEDIHAGWLWWAFIITITATVAVGVAWIAALITEPGA